MKIFILGAPTSGKTTITSKLRSRPNLEIIDTDDAIIALNGGVWPDIETKNNVLLPQVIEKVTRLDNIVLLNSYMPITELNKLKKAGFKTILLDVSEKELRRRHAERQAKENWSNEEWFEWHQAVIKDLREKNYIDVVISGEQNTDEIIEQILDLKSQ